MRTKLILICFLFFCISPVSAQYFEPRLSSFTDYGKCLYGLKERNGKEIIRKAEFTALQHYFIRAKKPASGYLFFWIAEKDGYFGALNDSGRVVVPFQYSEVLLSRYGCFLAKKDKEVSVINLSGEEQYHGTGIDEIQPLENGYIVSKDGRKGFLDLQLRELIPFDFNAIEPVALRRNYDSETPEHSPYLFHVSDAKRQGIYDIRYGFRVPCEYEFSEVHWADEQCAESQAIYTAFRDTLLFIYNQQGELATLVSNRYPPRYYFVPSDSCASKTDAFAVFHNYDESGKHLNMWVINLLTQEHSKTYDWISAKGNRFLCRAGKKWSVVDAHFRDIGQWTKWNASWEIRFTKQFDPAQNQNVWFHSGNSSRLWYRDNKLVIIYSDPSKNSNYLSFGLFDYEANKHTSKDYFRIDKLEYQQKPVYWAYKIAKENQAYVYQEIEPPYSQLDIYDENLELLRSLKLSEETPIMEANREQGISRLLFPMGQDEHLGAINGRGEQVIEAKYKNFNLIALWDKSGNYKHEFLYAFEDQDGYQVFDYTGKMIIAGKYQRFQLLENLILATSENSEQTLYSKTGNKLLDNISIYFVAQKSVGEDQCHYLKNNRYPNQSLIFFISDNRLFYMQGDHLSEVGPETFEFSSTYLRLNYSMIIDQNGKLADINGIRLTDWYSKCPQPLNELPVQKPGKTVMLPVPRKQPDYQWQHVIDHRLREDFWVVKNRLGVKLNDGKFDYPFNASSNMEKICREQGKYGLVGTGFTDVLPRVYDYIYPSKKSFLLFKDNSWSCFSSDGIFSPDTYDVISLQVWNEKYRLVFKKGKVGILTDSATYLVPLTDSVEFLKKQDLVKLLQLDKKDRFYLSSRYGLIFDAQSETVYREINNGQIIWYAYHHSTFNSMMKLNPFDKDFLNSTEIYFRYDEIISEKEVLVKNPVYYTERIKSYTRSRFSYSDLSFQRTYRYQANNYHIIAGKLVPLTLEELLSNAAAIKMLDELLIQKLNEGQYFGQGCTDLNTRMQRLKSNYLLTSHSLVFYWPDYPGFEIELYFSKLKGIVSQKIQKQVSEF